MPLQRTTILMLSSACMLAGAAVASAEPAGGPSFVEDFDRIDTARWYVSDGWANGKHQNCTWSKDMVSVSEGVLKVGFAPQPKKDRDFSCGEIQTTKRYGYGTYEARMKAVDRSGLNTAFFTYIGEAQKKPHDEIDFEVLGKDPSKVQLNQYVSGKGGNEELVPVPGGAAEGFVDYAFVWEKDRLRWFIDGELVRTVDDPEKIPTNAAKIFVSLWGSDTLKGWMGSFATPTEPVRAEVERVAFTALGDECQFEESVACALD